MRLQIYGIGAIGVGISETPADGTARLEKVPIENYTKPGFRRRFGRLSKLLYVASCLAIEDSSYEDPSALTIVTGTALGEAGVSVKLLSQIHASKGKTLSPGFVPNSVHNAPAGYLSIGQKNQSPSITVSQGWLSAEAAVALAQDMAGSLDQQTFLIVAGDEVDPGWIEQLREAGARDWAEALEKEAFQEGAVALVTGVQPSGRQLGSIGAAVNRCSKKPEDIRKMLKLNRLYPGAEAHVCVRVGTGNAEWRQIVAHAVGREVDDIIVDDVGVGTSLAGGFATLVDRMADPTCKELLVLGNELDDVSALHWTRTVS